MNQVTVLTAGSTSPLLSVEAAKSLLGLSGTAQDTLLGLLVSWATSAIQAHCGRAFAVTLYRELRSGSGSSELLLGHRPLAGHPTISYQGVPLPSDGTDWAVNDPRVPILYREVGWYRSTVFAGQLEPSPRPDSQVMDFSIDYPAGYLLDGETAPDWAPDAQPLPGLVSRATYLAVDAWYLLRRRDPQIQSRVAAASHDKDGQVTVTYHTPATLALPEAAIDLLRSERD